MKKIKLLTLLVTILFTLSQNLVYSQNPFTISGNVSTAAGTAVSNHLVNIASLDSSLMYNVDVLTDLNGFYSSSVFVIPGTVTSFIVSTIDNCSPMGNYVMQIVTATGIGTATADFIVCDSINFVSCDAYFTYSSAGSLAIDFADMSFTNPNTMVTAWSWDFGDGSSSTDQNPNHIFAASGLYQVCLDIVTSDSCTSTYCDYVFVMDSVINPGCDAYFTYSSAGSLAIDFADMSFTNPNTMVTAWSWDFGDGSSSTDQNPNHIFAASGLYQVCLDIVTSDSCTSTYCDYVFVMDSIINPGCDAYFTYSSAGSLAIDFTDMSFTNPGTMVTDWIWSFGDGTGSFDQNPNHTFVSAGYYEVCLTIQTSDSCSSTYCEYIYVSGGGSGNCDALFTYSNSAGNNFELSFSDASTGSVFAWIWDFGDGTISSDQNPVHLYNAPGTYQVCLQIFTLDSCNSMYCENITISQGTLTYDVSGSVWAGSNAVSSGIAILMNNTGGFWSSDIINGNYLFTNVDTGTYIVYAMPSFIDYPNYAPTYHDSALFWTDATEFSVTSSNVSNVDIYLIEFSSTTTGPCSISGSIIWPPSFKSNNTYKNRADNTVSDISLLLLDMDNNLISSTLSNESGYFEFEHLAYGTYKLQIDLPSYDLYPAIITLEENNPNVDNIIINITDGSFTYSVDEIDNNKLDNFVLYPNPVTDVLNIDFETKENGDINCSVINSFGQEVLFINENLGRGHQNIKLDVAKLAEGIYFVTIRQKSSIKTLRFFK